MLRRPHLQCRSHLWLGRKLHHGGRVRWGAPALLRGHVLQLGPRLHVRELSDGSRRLRSERTGVLRRRLLQHGTVVL